MMIYVIMSSKYLRIRQYEVLNNLNNLNVKMGRSSAEQPNHQNLPQIWRHYMATNRTIGHICSHIVACSTFWSPFLSVLFPHYITSQCYLLYLAVFASHIPMEQTYIYKLILSQFLPAFFVLVHQCAAVVKNNNQIVRQCRRFYWQFQMGATATENGGLQGAIVAVRLLKVWDRI